MVVAPGETVAVPEGASPVPTPLILTEVTFVPDQVRVDDPPAPIEVGSAVNAIVGAAAVAVTVTVAVAVPPAPFAVAVKVVVVSITTVDDPERPSEVWSSPRMLGLTVKVVAFVVAQVRVTKLPAGTALALAEKVTVGGAAVTVIVTVFWVLPPAPVATAVYVVSALIVTDWDPETGRALWPLARTEGVIVSEVALVEAQVRFTVWPEFTLVESAENVSVGAGLGSEEEEPDPPQAAKPIINATTPNTTTKRRTRRGTGTPQFLGRPETLDSYIRFRVVPEFRVITNFNSLRERNDWGKLSFQPGEKQVRSLYTGRNKFAPYRRITPHGHG